MRADEVTSPDARWGPGERFSDAVRYMVRLHGRQLRKGTTTPYVSHLLGVAGLVMEDGGDEDETIAALLHDAVEDQGGPKTLEVIREQFGERVANIVSGCSDTDVVPKPPWRDRKEVHLAHLRVASASVLRVSLADKLHNARALLTDYRREGDAVWCRFNAGREEQEWYYRAVLRVFEAAIPKSLLLEDLRRNVVGLFGASAMGSSD